jgi:hypothetical protein
MKQLNDRRTRHLAIPYQSFPFELAPHAPPGVSTDQILLLQDPTITADLTKTIKMTRPENAELIEMYLFMQMTAPSTGALNVKLGIQDVFTDHPLIAGTVAAYTTAASTQLTIEANLIHRIPQYGETGFVSDYFTLLVNFDVIPDPANGYSLDKFSCFGSAQIGLT